MENLILIITFDNINIIGEKIENDKNNISIRNPIIIATNPRDQSQTGLFPYLIYCDENECTFQQRHVKHVLTPKDELIDAYREYTTGVVIAPEKKIIHS